MQLVSSVSNKKKSKHGMERLLSWYSLRTWVWIFRTHVKLCTVKWVCNLFLCWNGRWKEEIPQKLVDQLAQPYTAVNNKETHLKQGIRKTLASETVLWLPYMSLVHACMRTGTRTHTPYLPTHALSKLIKRNCTPEETTLMTPQLMRRQEGRKVLSAAKKWLA